MVDQVLPTRIIGIDYGMARIGLAVSDERKILARPLLILPCERKLEYTVQKLLSTVQSATERERYIVQEFVIGLPLRMSGKRGAMADEVAHFAELIKQHCQIPVVLWDERLTSVQADRSMIEGGLTRKRRSQLVDSVAAVLILQSYLDSKESRTH